MIIAFIQLLVRAVHRIGHHFVNQLTSRPVYSGRSLLQSSWTIGAGEKSELGIFCSNLRNPICERDAIEYFSLDLLPDLPYGSACAGSESAIAGRPG